MSGSYLSRAGKIESSWKYEEDGCHISLNTPVKSEVVLPNGQRRQWKKEPISGSAENNLGK